MKATYPTTRALAVLLASATALAACVPPPRPQPAPASAPAPAPPTPAPALPPPLPTPPADWRDAAQTPGEWRWSLFEGRSRAGFFADGVEVVVLTCNQVGSEMLLARRGSGQGAVAMAFTASTGTRPLLSEPAISPTGWLVVPLHAHDPILDAIAFSRGRFVLEAQGQPTLYLPAWPEVGRVVEDCREPGKSPV